MSDPSPPRLLPMLAGGSGVPADPSAHQMEPKFDGVRALVFIDGGRVCVQGRRQNDVTDRYPELAGMAAALGGHSAVLDGEVVAIDDRGQLLQQRMHVASAADARRRMSEVPPIRRRRP